VAEDPGAGRPVVPEVTSVNPAMGVSTCLTCGGSGSIGYQDQLPTAVSHDHPRVTAVGIVSAVFPSLSVEKEFAQLLGQRDFKGFTDRETMYSILSKPENKYLARDMCFTHTPYNAGPSPAYVLWPEQAEDRTLLVDTLSRSPSTSEFDVVKGTIRGYAPPAMCNGQQIPLLVVSQLYSFTLPAFIESMPHPDNIPAEKFNAAVEEVFYRILRGASNATGPTLALAFAGLQYSGLYQLAAQKINDNSSLTRIEVTQSPRNPDRAETRLRFVKRDTGFSESYCFAVNYGGRFDYLEELLHPCIDVSIS
jgi:hypothetical protein